MKKIKKAVTETILSKLLTKWKMIELKSYNEDIMELIDESVDEIILDLETVIEDTLSEIDSNVEDFFDEQREIMKTEKEFNEGNYEWEDDKLSDWDEDEDEDGFKGLCEY